MVFYSVLKPQATIYAIPIPSKYDASRNKLLFQNSRWKRKTSEIPCDDYLIATLPLIVRNSTTSKIENKCKWDRNNNDNTNKFSPMEGQFFMGALKS